MRVVSLVLCALVACGKTASDAAPDAGVAGRNISEGGVGSSAGSSSSGASNSSGTSDTSGRAGASGGSVSGEGGSADPSAGQAGATTAGQRPFCGGSVTPANASSCSGLDKATLSDPKVLNLEGGTLSAGEDGTVEVLLTNPSDQSYSYPCVGFAADNEGVTFGAANPTYFLFSLSKGSASFSLPIHVNAGVVAGTVIHFTAWLDALHAGCTNGAELHWAETVN